MGKRNLPVNLVMRGDVYVYRMMEEGKVRRISLNTRNYREALEKYREILARGHEGFVDLDVTPGASRKIVSWEKMRNWDLDRASVASRYKDVEKGLGSSWNRLQRFFPDASAVNNDSLGAYARQQLEAGISSATIKRDLYAIMRGYEWAQQTLPSLPTFKKRIKIAKSPKGLASGRFIESATLAKIVRMLSPLPAQKLVLALTTGIRSEEYIRLQKSWIRAHRVAGKLVAFIDLPEGMTKNGRARSIPLLPVLQGFVMSGPNFKINYRKAWTTAAKKVGLERLAMRDLRHTFATTMAPFDKYGVDLIMGHVDPADGVSMRYQHGSDERLHKICLATLDAWPWLKTLAGINEDRELAPIPIVVTH